MSKIAAGGHLSVVATALTCPSKRSLRCRRSRVLGPAVAQYLRTLAEPGTERVLLLIGEVAPDHWWERLLFNNRGAVVARYAGRHSTAVVCRLRFRLLPRPTRSPTGTSLGRRSRVLVLPRSD